jgi:hypothetical protein
MIKMVSGCCRYRPGEEGAPNSPLSPYATFLKNGSTTTARVMASDITGS